VLDAARELKLRKRDDIRLVLIGQGKLKPALQKRAAEEQLDNVIFHDPVNKARLSGLMASADLGLQILANVPAFYYGTSPNKFFDYIASGLPVLNNYPGWLAEMISTENCGFVVPPDDAALFADALIQAADDRDELRAKGARGRELAVREFDRRKLADRFVDWLEGVAR
jgi:glycosyltransferase involved in cell wall biosynthesis